MRFSGLLAALLLLGCSGTPSLDTPVKSSGFHIGDVAKSDIDLVAEITVRQSRQYLAELARKLYRRNPDELRLGHSHESIDSAVEQLMGKPGRTIRSPWDGIRSGALVARAFEADYKGDRVAALIYGLRTMMADAYGGEKDFYLSHQYDPQKIYYLARNIEIAAWRLKSKRDADGHLYLLSTGPDHHGVVNMSFERLFGKLIALQDHFAQIVADAGNRRIKNVIQTVASAVFFPI